jgi:hypothetical protein
MPASLAQQRGLTGVTRDAFVGAAIRTCNAQQMAAPENVGISKPPLLAYCNCYANANADLLSDADMVNTDLVSDPQIASKVMAIKADCIRQVGLSR